MITIRGWQSVDPCQHHPPHKQESATPPRRCHGTYVLCCAAVKGGLGGAAVGKRQVALLQASGEGLEGAGARRLHALENRHAAGRHLPEKNRLSD